MKRHVFFPFLMVVSCVMQPLEAFPFSKQWEKTKNYAHEKYIKYPATIRTAMAFAVSLALYKYASSCDNAYLACARSNINNYDALEASLIRECKFLNGFDSLYHYSINWRSVYSRRCASPEIVRELLRLHEKAASSDLILTLSSLITIVCSLFVLEELFGPLPKAEEKKPKPARYLDYKQDIKKSIADTVYYLH